jgi:Protein of unknown function (DUF4241)
VVAAEPWAYSREEAEERVFVQRAEPGTYPVQLIRADYYDPGNPRGNAHFSLVAAARLVIRDEPTARWRLALRDGQDDRRLAADEFYGYPVDGGTGSFASPELFDRARPCGAHRGTDPCRHARAARRAVVPACVNSLTCPFQLAVR